MVLFQLLEQAKLAGIDLSKLMTIPGIKLEDQPAATASSAEESVAHPPRKKPSNFGVI